MLRGYWYLVVINDDIFLLRLFDFHVAETCSHMLTGFLKMYMTSSLSWLLGCCVRLNILLSALVLIEPSHLRGQSSIT